MQQKLLICLTVFCLVFSLAAVAFAVEGFTAKQIELVNQGDKLLVEQNKPDLAMKCYDDAIKLGGGALEVLYVKKGIVYGMQGKLDDAFAACKEAMKINPKSPDAYGLLGELQLAQNKKAEAEKSFKKVLELDPKDIEGAWRLANFYLEQNQKDKAFAQGKAALAIDPNNMDSLFEMAGLYIQMGNNDEAEACGKKMVELEPKNMEAHAALARIYVAEYKVAAANNNKDVAAQKRNLAIGQANAIQAISKANPRYPWAASEIYLQVEDLTDAKIALSEVVKMRPDIMEAWIRLGQIAFHEGNYQQAITNWKKVEKENADDVETVFYIGVAYKELGDKSNAKAYAEKVLKYDPNNEQAKALIEEVSK